MSTAPLPLALAPIIPGNHPPANVTDPGLPSLPQKLHNKIIKREYIDVNDLLSSNLYPVHSSATSNNFTLALNPQDTSTLAFGPTQQRKRRIDGLSSWMEAWNVYLRTLLASYPHLAPDLLAYQAQICKFSRKFKSTAWLMYDTAFRHMAASNVLAPWSNLNEQLYSDILKEETLTYCISCHTYGHRTLACPARSKSNQPFRSSTATSVQALPTSHLDPNSSSPPPSAATSTDVFADDQTASSSTSATSLTVEATILARSAPRDNDSITTPSISNPTTFLTLLLNSRTIQSLSLIQIFSMIYSGVATTVRVPCKSPTQFKISFASTTSSL